MKGISSFLNTLFVFAVFVFAGCAKDEKQNDNPQFVTDVDGNTYETIKIGNQIWMAKNLAVTKFRNGDEIPNREAGTEWVSTTSALCFYDNKIANKDTYGCLYNWGAVDDPRGLAPEGWHIPSVHEFNELENTLGGDAVAASKLGTWGSGTNESGFSALPAGYRQFGAFIRLGDEAWWWTSSQNVGEDPAGYFLINSSSRFDAFNAPQSFGLSVRCIKD